MYVATAMKYNPQIFECQGGKRKLGKKKESSIIRSRGSAYSIILSKHQNPSIHIIHSRTQTKDLFVWIPLSSLSEHQPPAEINKRSLSAASPSSTAKQWAVIISSILIIHSKSMSGHQQQHPQHPQQNPDKCRPCLDSSLWLSSSACSST